MHRLLSKIERKMRELPHGVYTGMYEQHTLQYIKRYERKQSIYLDNTRYTFICEPHQPMIYKRTHLNTNWTIQTIISYPPNYSEMINWPDDLTIIEDWLNSANYDFKVYDRTEGYIRINTIFVRLNEIINCSSMLYLNIVASGIMGKITAFDDPSCIIECSHGAISLDDSIYWKNAPDGQSSDWESIYRPSTGHISSWKYEYCMNILDTIDEILVSLSVHMTISELTDFNDDARD